MAANAARQRFVDVVPELTIKLIALPTTSVNLSIFYFPKKVFIDNVQVTINNQTLPMVDNKVEFINLNPKQSYEVTFTYDLTYQGSTEEMNGEPFTITTGKTKPIVNKFTYELKDNEYLISWDYSDPDQTLTQVFIKVGTEIEFLKQTTGSITMAKSKVEGKTINLVFKGDWDSDPSGRFEFTYIAEEDKPIKKGCQLNASLYYMQTILTLSAILIVFKRKK